MNFHCCTHLPMECIDSEVCVVVGESGDYGRTMGRTQKIQFGNACADTVV
jgi:hypothetical protein